MRNDFANDQSKLKVPGARIRLRGPGDEGASKVHRVAAADIGEDVGKLQIVARPIARRLGASGAPPRETGHRDPRLLELRRGLGGIDVSKIEDGKGRRARLHGVKMQAGGPRSDRLERGVTVAHEYIERRKNGF